MRRGIKRFLVYTIALVLLVVVFGGLVFFNRFRDTMIAQYFASQQPPPVVVSAAPVTSETWENFVEAVGTISAIEGVTVSAEVPGVVREILFSPGETVQQGDVLIQLDDDVEQADLALYEAQRALAQSTLNRTQTLAERGTVATASLDQAVADLAVAEAQVARTQALIEQKAIRAPFDGIVGIRQVPVGAYVQPGTPLVSLQALERVYVNFTVPASELPNLENGQPLSLSVDAFPDRTFSGTVTGIDPEIDPATRAVRVQGTLENPDGLLRPGIFARVRVKLPDRQNVVTVAETAITYSLYGDTVYVVQQQEPEAGSAAAAPAGGDAAEPPPLTVQQTFVRVGQRRNNRAEILAGLEPGQQVVTSGQLKLQNGFPVIIDNTVDPASMASRLTE